MGAKCTIQNFSMNILTWFEPTIELDTLMALICTRFPSTVKMSRRKMLSDPGIIEMLSFIASKQRDDLRGIGLKASGPCFSCLMY